MTTKGIQQLRRQQAAEAYNAAKAKRDALVSGLPHLFGWKWYAWAKSFFESTNKMNLLCAANQISKSSTQIRKCIHWATCVKLWPRLWSSTPRQFWYLYPSKDVATAEWFTKILPEFMPRHEYKDHPVYGWRVVFDKKQIHSIEFNSGVTVYFKTYAQDVHTLQTGTCHAIFCDEELPEELYDELKARLFATDGYFHMVFTATRNQIMWLRAIEGKGVDELFPDAFKLQVSMYDCITFTDGTPGVYNEKRIAQILMDCKNKTEQLRRVWGRFVREHGRVYNEFDPLRHLKPPFSIPQDWLIFSGIDNGSGGSGHPGAWSLLAVRPDFGFGAVFRGWKGDDGTDTTAGDILEKYIAGRGHYRPIIQTYDWGAKDLKTIADRMGESLTKAEKSHDIGEDIVNTLFKNNMLVVFDTPALRPLGTEFMTVMRDTDKRRRKDDLSDTVRYSAAAVPWDWSKLRRDEDQEKRDGKEERPRTAKELEAEAVAEQIRQRRGETRRQTPEDEGQADLDAELDFWNELAGNG